MMTGKLSFIAVISFGLLLQMLSADLYGADPTSNNLKRPPKSLTIKEKPVKESDAELFC